VRLLIDTHVLLWLMQADPRLTSSAQSLIVNASEVHVSAASIWEIAIKWKLGKIEEHPGLVIDHLDAAGLKPLAVTQDDAMATAKLPPLHRDPFDRLLIAQAIRAPMNFLTADAQLTNYSELVKLI
jgi:PIN domain nuclease of toxin-antitoxin system